MKPRTIEPTTNKSETTEAREAWRCAPVDRIGSGTRPGFRQPSQSFESLDDFRYEQTGFESLDDFRYEQTGFESLDDFRYERTGFESLDDFRYEQTGFESLDDFRYERTGFESLDDFRYERTGFESLDDFRYEREKSAGYLLCEAPRGPFRQKVPDTYFPTIASSSVALPFDTKILVWKRERESFEINAFAEAR